jgi:quinol monooxygenase YgiN
VVQVLFRITVAAGRVGETLQALHHVVRGIRREEQFADAHVHVATDVEEDDVVWLCEEWPTLDQCEQHLRSRHFARLLALAETSVAPPLLECRVISESRGLDYFAAVRDNDVSALDPRKS